MCVLADPGFGGCPQETLTSKAVAAILQRQGGHPGATGSSPFDKQVVNLFRGPRLVSVPPCPHIGGRVWRLLVMLEQVHLLELP